jgi:hypothetical protein
MAQEDILSKLPDACYSVSDYNGDVIFLKKGELGYYSTPYSDSDRSINREIVNHLNAELGVSWAQEQAMKVGSLFGWNVPAIDPDRWSPHDTFYSVPAENSLDDEKAFSLNNGEYFLYIQTYEDGYDYTIYHKDYSEYDGGQLDNPELTIEEAAFDIINDFSKTKGALHVEAYDPDLLQESVYEAEGITVAETLSSVTTTPLDQRLESAQARSREIQNSATQKSEERAE